MNANLYIRKSREDLDLKANGTLSMQKETILRDSFDYDIYEEIVSGDKNSERPQFQKMLEGIQRGKYQAIVYKDLSRLNG